jgi:hypothetical protein
MLGAAVGCEHDAMNNPWGLQPPPQLAGTGEPTTRPAPLDNVPVPTQVSPVPQVAALQQDIEDFVNRFPDNEAARKAGVNERAAEPPPPRVVAAPTSQPSPAVVVKPAPAPVVAAKPTPVPQPVATVTPKAESNVVRAGSPGAVRAPAVPEAGGAAQQASAPPPSEPVIEKSPAANTARANVPLAPREVVRATPGPAPTIEAIEIAPVPEAAPVVAPPPKVEPNRATAAQPAAPVVDAAEKLSKMEAQVAERPNDLDAQFRLRMLYLAEGMEDKATSPVAGLAPETGELFKSMMGAVLAIRDAARDPMSRTGPAMEKTQQLHTALRSMAPITIDRALLVSRVNSYGDYDVVLPAEFPVGQMTRTILYAEISNFRSEKGDDGLYRTLLSLHAEVFDETGKSVWKQAHDKIPDSCRRIRNDFFLACEVELSETLPAGRYTVKVTVEDKLSATADQAQTALSLIVPKQPVASAK